MENDVKELALMARLASRGDWMTQEKIGQIADALDQKDAEIEALRKQVVGLRETLGEAAEHICFYGPLEHGGDYIVAAYDDLMNAATDDLAGYVLVPVEPTTEMKRAGARSLPDHSFDFAHECYAQMIAARGEKP